MAVTRAQAPLANFSVAGGTTIAKAITLTVGNVAVVCVQWLSATATCTVADTLSNTYTAVAASLATNATSAWRGQCFLAPVTTGGSTTITATISVSVNERDLWIHELAGVDTAVPLDIGAAGNANNANPSINITPTGSGAIVASTAVPIGTASAGATYTIGVVQNGNASEDKMGTSSGVQAVPFVDASGSQWILTAVAVSVAPVVTLPVVVMPPPIST